MWHNEVILHLVPRLTICAAYTNCIDMDNTTFYCCLCSAFICSLSWLLWLMPNNAMVSYHFWGGATKSQILLSPVTLWSWEEWVLAEDVQLEALSALWWGEGENLVSTFPKVCLWSNRSNWEWNHKPLISQVQGSKTKHGSTRTYTQFTRLLTEQVIVASQK